MSLEVAKEILAYFAAHPQAADSLEGIARWRLLEHTVGRSVEETERAVVWLVGHGFLTEARTGTSLHLFRLNREKAAEARAFVAGRWSIEEPAAGGRLSATSEERSTRTRGKRARRHP